MIQLLSKWATLKTLIPYFLIFSFFTFFLFPRYEQQLIEIAGEKVQILDKYSSYTTAQVSDLFTKLKAEGRDLDYFITSVIDMIYPLVYGPFFMLLIAFFMKKMTGSETAGLSIAFFLPLLVMLTDYAENFTTLQLLSSFPNLDEDVVFRGSKLANLKLILIILSFGAAFFSCLGWVVKTLVLMTVGRNRG